MPLARLLVLAELVVLAREHVSRLQPAERRRLLVLLRRGRGRPARLSRRERMELAALVAKAEPKLFAQLAVEKVTGIKLRGRDRRR
jgi:hypothetical protein